MNALLRNKEQKSNYSSINYFYKPNKGLNYKLHIML